MKVFSYVTLLLIVNGFNKRRGLRATDDFDFRGPSRCGHIDFSGTCNHDDCGPLPEVITGGTCGQLKKKGKKR